MENQLPSEVIYCLCDYLDNQSLINLKCINKRVNNTCVSYIKIRNGKRDRSAKKIMNRVISGLIGKHRKIENKVMCVFIEDKEDEIVLVTSGSPTNFDIFNTGFPKVFKYLTHVYRMRDVLKKEYVKEELK